MEDESTEQAAAELNVPAAARRTYPRNFIRQTVCELRFPTLFDLERPIPPASFAAAMRHEFPHHELRKQVAVTVEPVERTVMHSFASRKQDWSVTLRASAVSVETKRYTTFEKFCQRLQLVVDAARKVIDSDFFTRVGLRYINVIPYQRERIREWVNPGLVGPLGEGVFGDPAEHWGRVNGRTPLGGFLLQHGFSPAAGQESSKGYILDFDFFAEDVAAGQAVETVKGLKAHEFSFFDWAIGPAAKAHLSAERDPHV